jgi:hypothetical protein
MHFAYTSHFAPATRWHNIILRRQSRAFWVRARVWACAPQKQKRFRRRRPQPAKQQRDARSLLTLDYMYMQRHFPFRVVAKNPSWRARGCADDKLGLKVLINPFFLADGSAEGRH